MRLDSSVNTLITSKANTDLPSFSLNIQPGWQNSKINFIKLFISFPVGKIAKKNSLKDCIFVNSALQKYTSTDCFFGDFAHWLISRYNIMSIFLLENLDILLCIQKVSICMFLY